MAEEILRRVAALRLAAALAVALTIAGFTTRDTIRDVADTHGSGVVPRNSIGSQQVKNHSLTSKDFKDRAVLSEREAATEYWKLTDGEALAKGLDALAIKLSTGLADIESNFLKLDDFDAYKTSVDNKFLKLDSTYLKGQGSVLTGMKSVTFMGTQTTLLSVPSFISVAVRYDDKGREAVVTNNSTATLTVAHDGQETQLGSGSSTEILIALDQPTLVQVIGGGTIGTVTLTGYAGDGSTTFTGQALLGAG